MVSTQVLFAAVCVASSAVDASAIPSVSSIASLTIRHDTWAEHKWEEHYPPNERVCQMVTNKETNTWANSKASDYFATWMEDNDGDLNDWVQKMHINATADSELTPADLDCTMLHSQNCQPPRDGDCEKYNPAAFHVIHTEVANLYSIFQALDIASIKEAVLTHLDLGSLVRDFYDDTTDNAKTKRSIALSAATMWIIAGLFGLGAMVGPVFGLGTVALIGSLSTYEFTAIAGGFIFNTIGASLSMGANSIPNDSIYEDAIEDSLASHLGNMFDEMSQTIAGVTSKLLGGTPEKDVDISEFLSYIDPSFKQSNSNNDYEPIMHLLSNDWFLDQVDTDKVLTPLFDGGFKLMKIGLIGWLFRLRNFYVLQFSDLDEESCNDNFEGASRFVDDACFVLKIAHKCINHDDNAPTELNKAEDYGMNIDEFFRNVRDCNNNKDMIENKDYSMETLGNIGECFFPLYHLQTTTPDYIWDVDAEISDVLGLKFPYLIGRHRCPPLAR